MSIDEIEARLAAHNTAISALSDQLADVIGKQHHVHMRSLIAVFERGEGENQSDYRKWLIDELRDVFAR